MFCFFERFLEDIWRRLWCRWTTMVMLRCSSVALGAALQETYVLVSSSETSVRSSITFTSTLTERLFAHRSWEKKTANGKFNHLFEVQQCLGFCNYYRQFISKYSEQVEPLTRLTKKHEPFVWETERQLAFETMVEAFTTAPVLQHFDHDREVIIDTDGSE